MFTMPTFRTAASPPPKHHTFCTSYCNKAHDISTGRPVGHGCRVIPHEALAAERFGNFERAIAIMQASPAKWMKRGMRAR